MDDTENVMALAADDSDLASDDAEDDAEDSDLEDDLEGTGRAAATAAAESDSEVSEVDSEDARIDELLRRVKVPKQQGKHGDVHDALEGESEEQLLQRTLKNWGRNKHNYYSTNFIDPDYDTDSEEERMVGGMQARGPAWHGPAHTFAF